MLWTIYDNWRKIREGEILSLSQIISRENNVKIIRILGDNFGCIFQR